MRTWRSGRGYVPKHLAPAPRHRRLLRPLAVTAVAAAAAVGSGAVMAISGADRPAPARGEEPDGAAVEAQAAPSCTPAPLAHRAGLVLMVGLPQVTEPDQALVDDLAAAQVGGVMLRDENLLDQDQAGALVDGLRRRLGDHLLVAVDEEGGRVSSMRALGDRTPSARRLGAAGPDAAAEAGAALGELAASVGIDLVLGPVADLDGGPSDGIIGDRSFGDDPDDVAEAAAAFASGLRRAGVMATAKHFPGHGGEGDPHLGATVDEVGRSTLVLEDLAPFRALIEEGADAVMVGHVTYPLIWGDTPASLEPGAYDLLRRQGFDGVAITDSLGMGAVHARWGFDVAPAMALAAGADLVLVTQGDRVAELHQGLVAAVRDGRLDEARLDEAVARVLALRGQDPTGIVCP